MPPKSRKPVEAYHLPDKLRAALVGITDYPLTLIEAPSGFGKTTSLRAYLSEALPRTAQELWHTCFGESAGRSWQSICDLLERVDTDTARALRVLEFPSPDMLGDTVILLRAMPVRDETVLVIDNFQLMDCGNQRRMIEALSMHDNPKLHVVLVTQPIEGPPMSYRTSRTIHAVGDSVFFFAEKDIETWFRLSGMPLTAAEVRRAHETTEGWIAALRLQMLRYRETGSFENSGDIARLMESAFWDRMSQPEQEFLLKLSLLDRFTPRQAAVMLNEKTVPGAMMAVIAENPFIRLYGDTGAYAMHAILRDFLHTRMKTLLPEEFRQVSLRSAGDACALEGEYFAATRHYYAIRDFDAVLSLPLGAMDFFGHIGEKLDELLVSFLNECPEDTLLKYPFSLIAIAFELFARARYEEYGRLCGLLGGLLQAPGALPEQEAARLAGELEFLQSFSDYNDIVRMSARHKAAFELLGGRPSLVSLSDPWTFGAVSVVYMFWREPGGLDATMACMDECLPYYIKLTRGHGTGADCALRAEALLLRGDCDEAESLCHKTLYLAGGKEQESICFCAGLTLARIALLRGDTEGFQTASESINKRGAAGLDRACLHMADMCRALLGLALGADTPIPEWLMDMTGIERHLYSVTIPLGQVAYGRHLLHQKQYGMLCGLFEPAMELARVMNCLLPQVYHNIHSALAREAQGRRGQALGHLRQALELAMPDGVCLPFAEYGDALAPLLGKLRGDISVAQLERIAALTAAQTDGVRRVAQVVGRRTPVLTAREREVALMARDGMTTKEIAAVLYVSSETVKMTLKKIFQKLSISSRAELKHCDIKR